jgi:elongation factor Ts
MATIDAASVKKLREMTNAGMMDCKKALVEAEGDFERAVTILREKGMASADKKGDRAANEGAVGVYVNEDATLGAIVEVNCETDFVARNDNFRSFVADLARQAAFTGTVELDAFLGSTFVGDDSKTVDAYVKESISTLGENIVVKRFVSIGTDNGVIGSYVHSDAKKGALVVAEGAATDEAKNSARDIAMQAVALRAPYLNREGVPTEVIEAEKAIYRAQAAEEGKPEAMQDKIAEGRVNKYFKEATLTEQAFIKDDKKSVAQVAKEAGSTITQFVRFEVGQSA